MTFDRDDRAVLLEVVPYGRLVTLTHRLATRVGVTTPQCLPLTAALSDVYDGRTDGRRIWYAQTAPVHTVAHELAHVLARDRGHGRVWWEAFAALATVLTDVT